MTPAGMEERMAKFNKNTIRGIASLEEEKGKRGFRAGEGLLNEASKKQAARMKITYLVRDDIEKNENNKYSIGAVSSLAWSIDKVGLLQPLHVMKAEGGRYRLLGGERRLTAIDQLIADPSFEEWDEDTRIPCIVKNPEEMALPLDSELKEVLSIITTNKESRKYTDADRLMEIREWKKIIQALRESGVESIPGADAGGNEGGITIKGEKTRDILVKTTGMSRGTIKKYEKVENRGSDAVKEALMNSEISLSTAEKLADCLEPEEQDKVVRQARSTGKAIDRKKLVGKEGKETASMDKRTGSKDSGLEISGLGAASKEWTDKERVKFISKVIMERAEHVSRDDLYLVHEIMLRCQDRKGGKQE